MVQSCPDIEGGRKPTTHSAHKHLIQKLQDNVVDNGQIMQISGNKNVSSVLVHVHVVAGQYFELAL
jgi:hypothetical protein